MTKIRHEGVIKYKCQLKVAPALEEATFLELEKWRAILYKMGFIGEYPTERVGYGNLSRRIKANTKDQFVITGTQTGKYPHLTGAQYTKVVRCDLKKSIVEAIGPIAPSSESLTHYAIYSTQPQINVIFHVHHPRVWKFMLENKFEKTPADIEYGTIAMANEVKQFIKNKAQGIFAMEGHEDGIIVYGTTIEETGKILLDTLKQSKES